MLPEIKKWMSRMLELVYTICRLDAFRHKGKDDNGGYYDLRCG
ncbi:hypothetical protein [Hoylesella oralis]